MKPVLNERKCPAQGKICLVIPACPEGAVEYVADPSVRMDGRIIFNYDKCNECGICATTCCGNAIDLE